MVIWLGFTVAIVAECSKFFYNLIGFQAASVPQIISGWSHTSQHNQIKSEKYSMRRGLWRGRKIPKKYWLLCRIRNLYCDGWISIFSSIFSRFHFYFPTTQSGQWVKIWKIVILGKLLLTILFIINVLEFYSAMMEWRKFFLKRTHIYAKNFPFSAHFGCALHTFLFLEAERDINLKNPILAKGQ